MGIFNLFGKKDQTSTNATAAPATPEAPKAPSMTDGWARENFQARPSAAPEPDKLQTTPEAPKAPSASGPFHMVIEDVFSIKGRGTIVTGRVDSGVIHINDHIIIHTANNGDISTVVAGIEAFHKNLQVAEAGDNVGLLLKDVARETLARDDVVVSR